MTKFSTAIEKGRPDTDLFLQPASIQAGETTSSASMPLITRIFAGPDAPKVVAFVGAAHSVGVTRTTGLLASALSSELGRRAAVLPASALDGRISVRILGAEGTALPSNPAESLDELRAAFDCVLIDCQPLDSSADLAWIASLADAVVLVVEAGRTSKEQIERSAAAIQAAKGNLIGLVLNKRRYPVPHWLFRMVG